jgi:hypothetical protein
MRINPWLFVLTLMIIVIVVLIADNMLIAMIISGLVINYAIMSGSEDSQASVNAVGWGVPDLESSGESGADIKNANTPPAQPKVTPESQLLKQSLIDTLPPVIQRNWDRGIPGKDDQNTNMYGQDQLEYDNYINAYSECYDPPQSIVQRSCSEADGTMDTANVRITQQRARDKKCMDGFVTKMSNPDFMRHHYAGELDAEENKVWWGRSDY